MYVNMDHVYITFPSHLQGHPRPISPGALIGICDCPSDMEVISMFYVLCSVLLCERLCFSSYHCSPLYLSLLEGLQLFRIPRQEFASQLLGRLEHQLRHYMTRLLWLQ